MPTKLVVRIECKKSKEKKMSMGGRCVRTLVVLFILSLGASSVRADGKALFTEKMCSTCHSTTGSQLGKPCPALGGVGTRRDKLWLMDQLRDPKRHNPQSQMPQLNLSDHEIGELVEYLRLL